MKADIHDIDKQLEAIDRIIVNSDKISSANKELILKYKRECYAEGLTTMRIVRCMYHVRKLSEWFDKDFETATLEDVKDLVIRIERSEYSNWTKRGLKIVLRKLFRYIKGTGKKNPSEVDWIVLGKKGDLVKLPEEMLSEDEIKRLIDVADTERDRAFASLLYESGCRIGEILGLCMKHVNFDQYGAIINVDGKTGRRRLRIISSVPYIMNWMDKHPEKNNPESPLWISRGMTQLKYATFVQILERLKKRAKIKKKVNPHNFRHSRATYLANHLTEAQMKEFFGWRQSSEMASVYVHLSGRDVDNALLRIHGIDTNNGKKEETILKPKTCPRCQEIN
ncbi:MAG: tyrosine-type recombinase/integrase [Candidatus Aenigmatarchaeota archaeon]